MVVKRLLDSVIKGIVTVMRLVNGARKEVKLKSPVGPAIRDDVGE